MQEGPSGRPRSSHTSMLVSLHVAVESLFLSFLLSVQFLPRPRLLPSSLSPSVVSHLSFSLASSSPLHLPFLLGQWAGSQGLAPPKLRPEPPSLSPPISLPPPATLSSSSPRFPPPPSLPFQISPIYQLVCSFSFSFFSAPSLSPLLCSFLLSPPGLPLCSCPRRPLADPPLLPRLPGWLQRALRSPGEPRGHRVSLRMSGGAGLQGFREPGQRHEGIAPSRPSPARLSTCAPRSQLCLCPGPRCT